MAGLELGMVRIADELLGYVQEAAKTLSRHEIARQTGVDVAIISKWLSGDKTPAVTTLDKIADWLGVELTKPKRRPRQDTKRKAS